jgi:hypothetical protein
VTVKRFYVWAILGIILFLFGLFSGHDWTLYSFRTADLQNPEIYSRFMKFPVTFLCMVLAWITLRDAFNRKDNLKLSIAYSIIVLGDIVFFFDVHSVIGVFCFALAHLTLIYRNANGIMSYRHKGILWAILPLILALSLALMFFVFYPMLKDNLPYFYTLLGYAVIISGSLWAAIAAVKIGFFPRANAVLIVVGVACFFLSDICVGFYRSLPMGYDRVFATYLTWIFYAPALVLTSLSGYDLKKIFG